MTNKKSKDWVWATDNDREPTDDDLIPREYWGIPEESDPGIYEPV